MMKHSFVRRQLSKCRHGLETKMGQGACLALVASAIAACILNAEYSGRKIPLSYPSGDWQTLALSQNTVPMHVTGADIQGVTGTVEVGGLVPPGEEMEDDGSVKASLVNQSGTLRLSVQSTSKNERLTLGTIDLTARRSGALDLYSGQGDVAIKGMSGAIKLETDSGDVIIEQVAPSQGQAGAVLFRTEIGEAKLDILGHLTVDADICDMQGKIAGGADITVHHSNIRLELTNDTYDVIVQPQAGAPDSIPVDLTVPTGSGFNVDLTSSAAICIKVGTVDVSQQGGTYTTPIPGGTGATIRVRSNSGPISIHEPGKSCSASAGGDQ